MPLVGIGALRLFIELYACGAHRENHFYPLLIFFLIFGISIGRTEGLATLTS